MKNLHKKIRDKFYLS